MWFMVVSLVDRIFIALAPAAGVAALIAVAYGLGFRSRAAIENEAVARALIAEAEPDSQPVTILIDKEGAAALARLADGRVVVLRAVGDRFAVRAYPGDALTIVSEPDGVRVRFPDLGFPPLKLGLKQPDGATEEHVQRTV